MHFNEVIDLKDRVCYLKLDPPQKRTIFIDQTVAALKEYNFSTVKLFINFPKLLYAYIPSIRFFTIYSYNNDSLIPLIDIIPNLGPRGLCLEYVPLDWEFKEIYNYFWCSKFSLHIDFNENIQEELISGAQISSYSKKMFYLIGGKEEVEQKFLEFARKVDK